MIGIIEKLQQRLDEMKEDGKIFAEGLRGKQQSRWMLLRDADAPGKFDFDGWHEVFNREEAEERYVEGVTDKDAGYIKQDLALASNQSDLLSGMERDFCMRHRTRIRRLAHEATARRHDASGQGIIESNTLSYMAHQMRRASKDSAANGV